MGLCFVQRCANGIRGEELVDRSKVANGLSTRSCCSCMFLCAVTKTSAWMDATKLRSMPFVLPFHPMEATYERHGRKDSVREAQKHLVEKRSSKL